MTRDNSIMVISKYPWHLQLFPRIWLWSFHYLFQIPMNPIAFVIGIRKDVNSISFMAYLPTLCEVLVRSTSGPEIFYSYNKRGKKGGYNLPAKSQLRFWLTLFIEMHEFVSIVPFVSNVSFVTSRPFSQRNNLVCRRCRNWADFCIIKVTWQKYGGIVCLIWQIEKKIL